MDDGRLKLASWVGAYEELDLTLRTIRDSFTKDIDRVMINSKAEYERASIHPYAVARPLMAAMTADARRPLGGPHCRRPPR